MYSRHRNTLEKAKHSMIRQHIFCKKIEYSSINYTGERNDWGWWLGFENWGKKLSDIQVGKTATLFKGKGKQTKFQW